MLNSFTNNKQQKKVEYKDGEVVEAWYEPESKWYRAEVLEPLKDERYLVRYVVDDTLDRIKSNLLRKPQTTT